MIIPFLQNKHNQDATCLTRTYYVHASLSCPFSPQAAKRTENWLSFGQHPLIIKYWIKKGQLGGGDI